MLVVPAHPLLLSAFVLADSALPHGSAYRISGGYVVPEASHRAVTSPACPGRERLMEQPVSSGHTRSCEIETHATCRSHEDVLGEINSDANHVHFGSLLVDRSNMSPSCATSEPGEEESIPLVMASQAAVRCRQRSLEFSTNEDGKALVIEPLRG